MRRSKTSQNTPNLPLDTVSEKKRRGPKPKANPDWLIGRANSWRNVLPQVWPKVWPALEKANTEAEVRAALELAMPYHEPFIHYPSLILSVLKDPKFPKTDRGRINFFADSVAAFGDVSPRRSRDICAAERAAASKVGQILRWEYYIECSCGYEGHSVGHACPQCSAAILFPVSPGMF